MSLQTSNAVLKCVNFKPVMSNVRVIPMSDDGITLVQVNKKTKFNITESKYTCNKNIGTSSLIFEE